MNHISLFQEITKKIIYFLQNHSKAYEACVSLLKDLICTDFKALTVESNPITVNIEAFSDSQLAFIITEYAGFSQEAIHMLLDAMIRSHNWPQLYAEIQENIDEEKGKDTQGVPHLEIMRQGYRIDLGIETEEKDYSEITTAFLRDMRKIFNNKDNAFLAGALLALEGTAIYEFHILDKIIKEYDRRKGSGLLEKSVDTLTNLYIDGHKDFEIGHEAHLREAISPYIHRDNIHKLVKGYLNVCFIMNLWWEQLALESYRKFIKDKLKFDDIEFVSVSKILLNNFIH